ncbi:hypothetical protein BKA70DRAFT_1269467 [Coprinopsis sp. MPI-PUGE-AT-0042]|nr:hypothetical protein BKA70DRAFT_1269467 [Coprinopsis sp. MPI-PUGE-AT-0042]
MYEIASFLGHTTSQFSESLSPDVGFFILDDLLALILASCFSVVQVQISFRLICGLKLREGSSAQPPRSKLIADALCAILSVLYLVCTIILVANFATKLELVTRHLRPRIEYEEEWRSDPCYFDGTLPIWPWAGNGCVMLEGLPAFRATQRLDVANIALAQVLIMLSNALLTYRCHTALQIRWFVTAPASGLLLASLGLFIFMLASPFRAAAMILLLAGSYVALGANLLVSVPLFVHLCRVGRVAESFVPRRIFTQFLWKKLLEILIGSSLLSMLLGFLHIILWYIHEKLSPVHGVLWVSMTVVAPQIIALRFLPEPNDDSAELSEKPSPSVPLSAVGIDQTN